MKNQIDMKKIRLIAILIMSAVSFEGKTQETISETVFIRIQEAFKGSAAGLGRESEMIVIEPDGDTRIVSLEDLSKSYSVEGAQNGTLIKKEVDEWLNKHFEIISVSSDGDINVQRTLIVMKKIGED